MGVGYCDLLNMTNSEVMSLLDSLRDRSAEANTADIAI